MDGLQQRYLVKTPKVENLGLGNFWFTGFHRTKGAKIWGFWILNIGSPNTIRKKQSRFFSLHFHLKKNKNPQISYFLKYGPDKGDGDVDGDGENFNIENFSENEMAYSQHV